MKPDRIKWNSFQAASRMVSPPIVTIVKSPLMPWRQGFPNQFRKYRNRGMNIFTSAFVCKRARRHHILSAWNLLRFLSTQTKHILCYNTELSVLFDNSHLFSSAIFDKVPVSILHRQWAIYLKHAHTNACPHTHTVTETLPHAHTYMRACTRALTCFSCTWSPWMEGGCPWTRSATSVGKPPGTTANKTINVMS